MTHSIFGYRGFAVRVIPYQAIAYSPASPANMRYAVSVVITDMSRMTERKRKMRCYPGGICMTLDRALTLGKEYATYVIDHELSALPTA